MDVYHTKQLLTKKEAQNVASDNGCWGSRWRQVAATKDASTAASIADILDSYGFIDDAQCIRGKCVYSCLCL